MIHEVDESLRAFLSADPSSNGIDISFESPTRDWASRRVGPTINLFLHEVREDTDQRHVDLRPVRDEQGRIRARREGPRAFKLSYLVSAWTQRAEDEHRLLGGLLVRFLRHDMIPVDCLRGGLALTPDMVVLRLAKPAERPSSELWGALGGELKPSLDLLVVAPVDPDRRYEVGPPVLEQPHLGVDAIGSDGRPPRPEIREGPDGSEEVVAGRELPGRTLSLHRRERP